MATFEAADGRAESIEEEEPSLSIWQSDIQKKQSFVYKDTASRCRLWPSKGDAMSVFLGLREEIDKSTYLSDQYLFLLRRDEIRYVIRRVG
jgi:hypothetical protein